MKNGEVVYFRKARQNTHKKTGEYAFKGNAFGILLGHVPLFGKEPSPTELLRLMGTIGFLSFDNVAEFLGNEQAEICVKKFEDKYYGKVIDTKPVEGESVADTIKNEIDEERLPNLIESPRLVGPDGLPL